MDVHLPILLSGSNLRDRHRNLNYLVNKISKENILLEDISKQPEESPIDRIFKLHLASKYRNVEYVIKNLKDDDMLYVSKALKCFWLLEPQYSDIINPSYLETVLYPEMIKPAVNKMKHWISLHLTDTERCQIFYIHYKTNFDDAFNYFWRCSNEFIISEFPHIMHKLSPKQMKRVFENCHSVCKFYFENLPNNQAALTKYVTTSREYFDCIKSVMKRDSNLFLDITEKYFDTNSFRPFSSSATQYIMKYCRSRFNAKSELYASSFLHMETLATNLTSEEAKKLVLQIAQAEYLESWFSYKKVEPLLKRLKSEERLSLKKQVFVDKSIDCKVKEWPYPLPKPLYLDTVQQEPFFTDVDHEPYEYGGYYPQCGFGRTKKCIRKRKNCYQNCDIVSVGKSPLDQLFNRYRFIGFEETFYELSKKLLAESKIEGRLNMMLVLVSKSGGVTQQVEKFLKLMVERYKNEINTLRAAVIRSLVKRGCVWRLPENVWQLLLEFGRDIGLDGAETDPLCREGLHAVVLHNLLTEKTISPSLLTGFIRQFSTFTEYKLYPEEIKIVAKCLPSLVLAVDANAFLNILADYKINIADIPDAKHTLLEKAKGDPELVTRLYKAKMLRRELISETFCVTQNNAAYINALRHDTSLLDNGKKFAELVARERPNHDRFLKSLSIYFGEANGLAEQHRMRLEEAFLTSPKAWSTRSLCSLLSRKQLINHLIKLESERPQTKEQLLISSGLRANAHKTKPILDISAFDWRWLGAKAVANAALICRTNDREMYIKKLLEWRRTARISVRISVTTPSSVETFIAFSSLRPLAALKVALSMYLTKDYIEPLIWNATKLTIEKADTSKKERLLWKLSEPNHISKNVLGDYWALVYKIFSQIDQNKTAQILCRLENILHDVDPNFVRGVVKKFIDTQLDPNVFSNVEDSDFDSNNTRRLCVRVVAKHLLLCKSEQMQAEVIENVCEPFFNAIEALSETLESKKILINLLEDFVYALKYSKAFLSKQYVSCLPVIERILARLRKVLPLEEHFAKYVQIHLTMLYYKTIMQTEKMKPGIFDELEKQNEAIEIAGRIFGMYIGHEIRELVTKYFKSVVDLYKITLERYLDTYFRYGECKNLFITFTIKGLLETDTTEASILAEYIFQKEQKYRIPETHRDDILNALKKCSDAEVNFFLHADVISVPCM